MRLLALSLHVILTLLGINESAGRGVMEEVLFDRHRAKNAFYLDDRLLTIIDGARADVDRLGADTTMVRALEAWA